MTLDELLKNTSPSAFASDVLARKAHHRWDRKQLEAASLLFDAAFQRAVEEGNSTRADAYRNRAAVTLSQAGADPVQAIRRLNDVLDYYVAHPDRRADSHFAEWAAVELLAEQVVRDPSGFGEAYASVVERCRLAGRGDFPKIHPQQERIAEWARLCDAPEVMAELLPRMQGRRPMKRALKGRLKEWAVWLEGGWGWNERANRNRPP